MLDEAVRKKIEDLVRRAANLAGAPRSSQQTAQAEGWITEAVNVIELAIPIENNAYRRRIRRIAEDDRGGGTTHKVGYNAHCCRAFLPYIDAGLIADFGNIRLPQTFDHFLDN